MKKYLQGFKSDIFSTVFDLAGKGWLKITGAYAIYYGVMLVFAIAVVISIFGSLAAIGFENFQNWSDPQSFFSDPESILDEFETVFETLSGVGSIVLSVLLLVCISIIVGSWNFYLSMTLSDDIIQEKGNTFGALFNRSFSYKIFVVLGICALLGFGFTLAMFIAALLAPVSGFLTFLVMLAIFIFANKFILVIPALIMGNKSFEQAFAYSFKNITVVRCLKLFGVEILFFLSMIVVMIIIGLISFAISLIPVLGWFASMGISIFLSGFMTSLTMAVLLGLYYRYEEGITEESSEPAPTES